MKCHPERSLAHILRQTQSKDLRFGINLCNELQRQDPSIPQKQHFHLSPVLPSLIASACRGAENRASRIEPQRPRAAIDGASHHVRRFDFDSDARRFRNASRAAGPAWLVFESHCSVSPRPLAPANQRPTVDPNQPGRNQRGRNQPGTLRRSRSRTRRSPRRLARTLPAGRHPRQRPATPASQRLALLGRVAVQHLPAPARNQLSLRIVLPDGPLRVRRSFRGAH